jgi:hypothetical protein
LFSSLIKVVAKLSRSQFIFNERKSRFCYILYSKLMHLQKVSLVETPAKVMLSVNSLSKTFEEDIVTHVRVPLEASLPLIRLAS